MNHEKNVVQSDKQPEIGSLGESLASTPRTVAQRAGKVLISATEASMKPAASEDSESPVSAEDTERELAQRAIEFSVDSCRSTEHRFERRLAKLAEAHTQMSQEEFERFEDSYAHSWGQIVREVRRTGMGPKEEAAAEADFFRTYDVQSDLNKWSIDVRAADFYHERHDQLRQAITQSDDADKAKDLAHLEGFYDKVYDHIEFRYLSKEESMDIGYEIYEKRRMRAHNQLIRYFNHMNALCEKYGTRRFTVRDFWDTSAYEGMTEAQRRRLQTDAMRKRYRNDRDIVEEYYASAFPPMVKRFQTKMQRSFKTFGNY